MALTTLPEKTEDDLGPPLTNSRTPRENEQSAEWIENIKDRVIQVATDIGTDVDPDPDSLKGRMAEVEAGGIALPFTLVSTSPYTLDWTSLVLVVDTSTDRTLQLPAPGTVTGKHPVLIIDRDNNSAVKVLTLQRNGSEKIDNVAANKTLATNGGRWLVWTNGTDWFTQEMAPLAVRRTLAIAGNANIQIPDEVLLVDTTAPRTLTLPSPATAKGRTYVIKDVSGQAETNNITLARNGAEKIENVAASRPLGANFGVWRVFSDGTDWWLV